MGLLYMFIAISAMAIMTRIGCESWAEKHIKDAIFGWTVGLVVAAFFSYCAVANNLYVTKLF